MNIFDGRPKLRAGIYWANTILIVALACVIAWFEAVNGWVPDWVENVGKVLLAFGSFTNLTAATNIRGDAIDPTALPPSLRKALNLVFGIVQAAVLVLSIIFGVASDTQPFWVLGVNAILLVISGILSGVATSHVVPSPPPADEAQPENVVGGGPLAGDPFI